MRIVNLLSGIAVLLTTVAFGYLMRHYYASAGDAPLQSPVFAVGFSFGVGVGIFALIGAVLLLARGRH